MNKRTALWTAFASLLAVGLASAALQGVATTGASQDTAPGPFERAEPGTLPDQWIYGGDCASDPNFQVHAYNEDLYILRQSKCDTYEAPFLYLIFGETKALLIDTGAVAGAPVEATVTGVINDWLAAKGKSSIELIVAHSHSHGDHVAADAQFNGLPNTTVVGYGVPTVMSFYGFSSWPGEVVQFDLGGRVLDVLATPGHKNDSVTFYDRRTHLLLTGDIVYPGHLFIFAPLQWLDFQDSLVRLADWAETHPVKWVLGCHVEMTADYGVSYQYTTAVQPNEHPLELHPSILGTIRDAALDMGATPECKTFGEFVIHPVYLCGFGYF
ncbi:MAG: MBL fold metallo-hydrolase [Planctomycetota bacterium]